MRILYGIIIFVVFIFFLILYFTNIMWLGNQYMYLGSQSNSISVGLGMFIIFLIGIIVGFFTALLITSFIKSRPKDFDEYDL